MIGGPWSRRSTPIATAAIACLVLLALLLLAPARSPGASLADSASAVQLLNAWRSAVGVRPVVHDETLSRGCRRHAQYYAQNPTQRLHRELPEAVGYTEAGDLAARSSVLAYGVSGSLAALADWEPAPYHRMALLDPRLASTGFWSEFGLSCMQVVAVDQSVRTPSLTAYTYPRSGQRDVAPTFFCREIPNPCAALPNPEERTATGTNISIQFNGPWLRIESVQVTSASVAGAGRPPVDLTVQSRESELRGGIVMIPRRPLRLGKTYVATASGTVLATGDDGAQTEYPFALSWDFSTPGIEPAASLKVVVERVTRRRVHLRVFLLSAEARKARISLLDQRTPLLRVTRRLSGPIERISLPRPRRRITTVAVLLRGSPTQTGVAARVATDISAVRRRAGVSAARR